MCVNIRIIVFFLFIVLFVVLTSCHVGKFFYWNFADINDYKKFPSVPVNKSGEPFQFEKSKKNINIQIPDNFIEKENITDFDAFLKKHKTVAFLIIRNDTMLYEKYFFNYSDSSILPSFSMSKAYISALTGIAINEGFIKSTEQPVTDFLPELLTNDKNFQKIRIEDLLNMRSGIKFNEGYTNPFADMSKYYYGKNLNKYIKKLKIKEPPDFSYDYVSVNALLLAKAIEISTGKQLNKYLEEKIWFHLGMEYDASWNIDSKKHKQIKAFCCINARARDFAKFGRLYLNKGSWNGRQIVPEKWVIQSTSIINNSRDSQNYPYTHFWRVKEDGAFFAKGILGQYIYVFPKKNLIFVRLGKKYGKVNWADLFEKISNDL